MSEVNFAIVVNLSNFFNDHRHRARLYINDRIKTILDLQNKISVLFGIKNFVLISQNEFLPPTEDVRILHKDDILWVIPSKETEAPYDSFLKCKERKSRTTVLLDINESKKKKQKRTYSVEKPSTSEEMDEITSSGKRSKTKSSFEEEIQFNYKSKPQKSKESDKNEFEETHPKKSKKKKGNYLEGGPEVYETHKLNPEVEEYIQVKAKKKKNKNEENPFTELHKYVERSKKIIETIEEKPKKNMDKKEENQIPFSEPHESIERSKKRTEPVEEKLKEIKNKTKESQAPFCESDEFKKNSDEAGQVVVGNAISSTVFIKKNTPVPRNTDQYLKEKQINIVKIDYISKPVSASEPNSISSSISNEKVTENVELVSDIEEEKEINGIKEINNEQDVSFHSNFAEVKNNYQNFKESETNSMDTEPSAEKQDNLKNWRPYPRTKFFFMNTPSSKEKRENANQVVRPKKSNIFKLREDLRLTRFIPKIMVSQNEVVDVIIKSPENNLSVTQNEIDAEEKNQVPKNVATTATDPQNCNENVALTNGHSYNESSIIYDQQTEIIPSSCPEFEGIGSPGATLISNISPCLTNILDTPVDKDISGVEVLNTGKKSLRKQISGVGQFLDSIRKNRNSLVPENDESLECLNNSQNVTQRRRHRVRKRKSKSGSKSLNESVEPTLNYPKPLKVEACPKLHIKFSDDEDQSAKEISVVSIVSIESSEDDEKVGGMQLLEEDILKAPLMTDLTPNLNDIIVFKILKLSDNCSPEVSNYIMGHVRHFSPESKAVTFEITYGLDQLEGLEEMLCSNSRYHEFLWSDLLEPRLLYP